MSAYRLSRGGTNAAKSTVEEIEFELHGKPAVVQLEAIEIISEGLIDPSVEKDVVRKFDRRIVPWLFGMFLLCFLDRANIGNAKIEGLGEDLHLTSNQFNIALAVFFLPYILIEVLYPVYCLHIQQLTPLAAKQYDNQEGWCREVFTFPLCVLRLGMHMYWLRKKLQRTPSGSLLSWVIRRRTRSWHCVISLYVLPQGGTSISNCLVFLRCTCCWCDWRIACIGTVFDSCRLV
jgi:hypothetical protein